MSLDSDDVKKIAHLARLQIDDQAISQYTKSLSNILALVEQMSSVDTNGVEPMAHPHHAVQRLRDDVVTEVDQRDYFQQRSPAVEEGLFLVPKVVE